MTLRTLALKIKTTSSDYGKLFPQPIHIKAPEKQGDYAKLCIQTRQHKGIFIILY